MAKKTLLQQIKAVKSPDELTEIVGCDFDVIDISHRGGNLGFDADRIAELVKVSADLLPKKFGAYCNYLGGGLRGSICASNFSEEIPVKKANLLNELGKAIIRCYNYYEQEAGLQEEEYPDGETNWENIGTKASRLAGVVSAY